MDIKYISSVLIVKDLKSSRKFYEDFLNLKVQDDFGVNIGYTVGLSLWQMEHAYENIFQGSSENQISETRGHKLEIYFETDDVDKAYESAMKNGMKIIHGITLQPWGQKVFRIYDPDENIVEIGESMSLVNERIESEG